MTSSKSLPKRFLGSSGIEVSAIGLGCMSLSGVYGKSNDDDGIALIHNALDQGITLLDTSDMYGFGHNEELVGKAIKGRRDDVVLATKFGNLGGGGSKVADGRPEYVISSCEKSLKRLGVEVIDLYYQHRVDPTVPVEDTFGAMARLVEQGKVRTLGISEARPETIRRAHAVHPLAAVQNEYSLLYRTEAEETLSTTRELEISFVAYSPLGRGLLTGTVENPSDLIETDARRRHPRFAPENLSHNVALVQRIQEIARAKKCTPGQLALAWLLAQGEDIIPIPGTKRKERLIENIGALSIQLSDDEMAQISDAIPVGAIADMIRAGYVRHVGLSEVGADTIRRAHTVHPVADLQIEYSLMSRSVENKILPTTRELGIGITAYGILSRGLLSGRLPAAGSKGDLRVVRMPRFQQGNVEQNMRLVEALRQIGDEKGATPAQLALAWVRSRGNDILPVIGARRREQLKESLGALDLKLSAADLARIDAAVSPELTAGTRYDAPQMAHLDSEAHS